MSVRVGVNTGKFCRHGGAAGDWRRVNLAARLEQAAGLGGIIISFQTWCLVHDAVTAEAAGATQVELEVIDRFRTWLGMPTGTAGVLVTGGSAANLPALLVARQPAGGPSGDSAMHLSDQAHSSLARTSRAMGLRPQQMPGPAAVA